MSASLVGSEMCIRDRPRAGRSGPTTSALQATSLHILSLATRHAGRAIPKRAEHPAVSASGGGLRG
eukprot:2559610-Alexandrium_andersonii.AAC.1